MLGSSIRPRVWYIRSIYNLIRQSIFQLDSGLSVKPIGPVRLPLSITFIEELASIKVSYIAAEVNSLHFLADDNKKHGKSYTLREHVASLSSKILPLFGSTSSDYRSLYIVTYGKFYWQISYFGTVPLIEMWRRDVASPCNCLHRHLRKQITGGTEVEFLLHMRTHSGSPYYMGGIGRYSHLGGSLC